MLSDINKRICIKISGPSFRLHCRACVFSSVLVEERNARPREVDIADEERFRERNGEAQE